MSQIPGPPPQQALPGPTQQGPRKQPGGGIKVVIAALAMALVAVIILSIYIQGVKDQVAARQFTVFVLDHNVVPNDPVKRKDWKPYSIPDTSEFRTAFEKGILAILNEDVLRQKERDGEKYQVTAAQGSIITYAMFDSANRNKDLEVEPGKVRIALPIKSKTTPGGLRPGEYVDLAAPIQSGGTVPEMMIVMEGIRVKAVGTHTFTDESSGNSGRSVRNYSTVSFDVDQDIAIKLSTLEKVVRVIGEFELYITTANRRPSWQGGGINPKVLAEMEKLLPVRRRTN